MTKAGQRAHDLVKNQGNIFKDALKHSGIRVPHQRSGSDSFKHDVKGAFNTVIHTGKDILQGIGDTIDRVYTDASGAIQTVYTDTVSVVKPIGQSVGKGIDVLGATVQVAGKDAGDVAKNVSIGAKDTLTGIGSNMGLIAIAGGVIGLAVLTRR